MPPWQPDNPIELPGLLVCRAHKLVICGFCTVDYNFMSDDAPDLEGSEEKTSNFHVLIPLPKPQHSDMSTIFPMAFQPPSSTDTPSSLFVAGIAKRPQVPAHAVGQVVMADNHRFIRPGTKEMLIFTDGACIRNGQANPAAGCAFIFRPANAGPQSLKYGSYHFRLENRGPNGDIQPQTTELRAVIAALHYREWVGEGWNRLVVATDSEYRIN